MNAPERIWACMDGPMVGLFVSGGINMGWPEYVRADLFAALEAEKAKAEALLREAVEALQTLRDYVDDASRGTLRYRGQSDISEMAGQDLVFLDAILSRIKEAKNG